MDEHLGKLLRLADESTLREELTNFPLATSAEQPISEAHRPGSSYHTPFLKSLSLVLLQRCLDF